ncbi:Serine/threonine-protein phosphatase [Mycena kentingensis (nom. inval.)]|nr:Serine/threonine-protein phosphatase [Mycena kentingensis (nom. inval.)]
MLKIVLVSALLLGFAADARKIQDKGGSIIFEEAYTTSKLIQLTGIGGLAPQLLTNLQDIHNQRLAGMDATGVDYMVLSCANPCIQAIAEQSTAESLAREFNDGLAASIANSSDRFGAFAALSMHNATNAALELNRTVTELGFLGALINDYQVSGPNNDTLLFYDSPAYDPFWQMVATLDVPVYLHPRNNIKTIENALYSHATWLQGPAQEFAATLSTHILGICANGVFDRFPTVQLIVGHMGERIPSDLWRIDNALATNIGGGTVIPPMLRNITYYFQHNILETTAGQFTTDLLQFHASQIGIDRILHSVDYPYVRLELGSEWLDTLVGAMGPRELHDLKRGRAIKVLRLDH